MAGLSVWFKSNKLTLNLQKNNVNSQEYDEVSDSAQFLVIKIDGGLKWN